MKETLWRGSLEYFNYSPASATTSLSNISDFFFITIFSQCWPIVHSLPLHFALFILYLQYFRVYFFLECGMSKGKKRVTFTSPPGCPAIPGVVPDVLECWSSSSVLIPACSAAKSKVLIPRALSLSYLCDLSLPSRGWLQNLLFMNLKCLGSGMPGKK